MVSLCLLLLAVVVGISSTSDSDDDTSSSSSPFESEANRTLFHDLDRFFQVLQQDGANLTAQAEVSDGKENLNLTTSGVDEAAPKDLDDRLDALDGENSADNVSSITNESFAGLVETSSVAENGALGPNPTRFTEDDEPQEDEFTDYPKEDLAQQVNGSVNFTEAEAESEVQDEAAEETKDSVLFIADNFTLAEDESGENPLVTTEEAHVSTGLEDNLRQTEGNRIDEEPEDVDVGPGNDFVAPAHDGDVAPDALPIGDAQVAALVGDRNDHSSQLMEIQVVLDTKQRPDVDVLNHTTTTTSNEDRINSNLAEGMLEEPEIAQNDSFEPQIDEFLEETWLEDFDATNTSSLYVEKVSTSSIITTNDSSVDEDYSGVEVQGNFSQDDDASFRFIFPNLSESSSGGDANQTLVKEEVLLDMSGVPKQCQYFTNQVIIFSNKVFFQLSSLFMIL